MASFEKMREILPQKNILQAIIFALIVVITSFIIRFGEGTIFVEKNTPEVSKKESVQTILVKDTDADGLTDWEEVLWGTNSNQKDSDGDGVSDFTFVEGMRASLLRAQGVSGGTEATTTTDILGRQLFATLVSLSQTNSLNEKTLNSLTNAFTESIGKNTVETTLSLNELRLVENSPEAKRLYTERIKKTLAPYQYRELGGELIVLGKAMKSGNPKDLMLLATNEKLYTELAQKLLKLEVPLDIAETHTLLIKNYLLMTQAISEMRQIFTDPIVALFGISLYEKASSDALIQMRGVELYIKG